jgi:hypothetical protein
MRPLEILLTISNLLALCVLGRYASWGKPRL